MKALLLKAWAGNYPGQVFTNAEKGSIPADCARFYEDDAVVPSVPVTDGVIDPARLDAAEKAQKAAADAAKAAAEAEHKVEEAAAKAEAKDAKADAAAATRHR